MVLCGLLVMVSIILTELIYYLHNLLTDYLHCVWLILEEIFEHNLTAVVFV